MQVSSASVMSIESLSGCQSPWRGSRTLRRRPHSIRRISTVSVVSGFHAGFGIALQSTASWSWYSSSDADLMLMSRKRANSFALLDPQPSTMLDAIDSAALTIWNLSDPRSLLGNLRITLRTPSTSSWARCHTSKRRKSCTGANSPLPTRSRRQIPAHVGESTRNTDNH